MGAIDKGDVQARQFDVGLVGEQAGLAQRRAQRIAETARQPGQRFAGIRIRVLDPEVAKARLPFQRGQDRGDAIGRVQLRQLGQHAQLLPREDQPAPGQQLAQRIDLVGLAGVEHIAIVASGTRIAGNAGLAGAFGQFGGQFGFKTLAAVTQQAGHGDSLGEAPPRRSIGPGPGGSVMGAVGLAIGGQHAAGLFAQDVAADLDAALFQRGDPVFRQRAFVKAGQ